MRPPRTPPVTRFMPKLQWSATHHHNGEPCIEWTGARNQRGYGRFGAVGTVALLAHRWAYEFFIGPIPDGLFLDHLCRNPPCVNPHHLEPVTHAENMRRGIMATRESCARGHLYTEETVYVTTRGHRQCRPCRDIRRGVTQ